MNRLRIPTVLALSGPRAAGWVALVAWLGAAPAALAVPGGGNSAATITGSFADSCRDFAAHSSKDISYVELHYAAGSVVKDESITSPDWAIDGGPGEEIDFAAVKSGTTIQEFPCVPSNAAPEARLEMQTPPVDQTLEHCYDFFSGGLACEASSPRTARTSRLQLPDPEAGLFTWGCGAFTDPSQCSWTMTFRGTGSSDPDGDLASWSLDFSDGTSVSGTWSSPPAEVTHAYAPFLAGCTGVFNGIPNRCVVTLTVTDSAGQSASDTLPMVHVDQSPD
jgi:hypothetical protein